MDQQARFVIERPSEFAITNFRPGITESAVNVYDLEVKPLSFSEDRMSWSFRAPGIGVIMSNNAYISFDVLVKCNAKLWTSVRAKCANQAIINATEQARTVITSQPETTNAATALFTPTILFGPGDAFSQAIQSFQLTINGSTLSNSRQRDYDYSLKRAWLPPKVLQKRFQRCGGQADMYDSVCCSGEVNVPLAANKSTTFSGFTQDSGVARRIRNILACTVDLPAADNAANGDVRKIHCVWPINGVGIFSPLQRGDTCAASCVYRSSSRALCHMNVVSLEILLKDLKKTLIRDLSTCNMAGGAGVTIASSTRTGLTVTIDNDSAVLHARYMRLASWRQIPASAVFQTYRVAVHDPSSTPTDVPQGGVTIAAACLDRGTAFPLCIACQGPDRNQHASAADAPWSANDKTKECLYQGVTSAQIPTYIGFCLQKDPALYVQSESVQGARYMNKLGAQAAPVADTPASDGLVQQMIARNSNGNASVEEFELSIMSSIGSYTYSGVYPFLQTKADLWRDVQKYCHNDYFNGEQDAWQKHGCFIFLSCQEFARGLSTDGCSYPIQLTARVKYANRRAFVDGTGASANQGAGPAVVQDIIGGNPVMIQVFPRQSLQIAPSSSVLSSQNISHSSAMELLARR